MGNVTIVYFLYWNFEGKSLTCKDQNFNKEYNIFYVWKQKRFSKSFSTTCRNNNFLIGKF